MCGMNVYVSHFDDCNCRGGKWLKWGFSCNGFFFACDYEINCLYLPDDCSQMMSFGLLFFEFVVDSLSSHIKWTLCLGIKCWIWVE